MITTPTAMWTLGQCGIDTSRPNQLLMPVSKKAMNKNNKITQTQAGRNGVLFNEKS